MPHIITESEIEQVALDIPADFGYEVIHGPDIAPPSLKLPPEDDDLKISARRCEAGIAG